MSERPPAADPAADRRAAIGRAALSGALVLAVVIFVAGVTASYHRSHSVGEILGGVFSSLFIALLVAAAASWAAMSLVLPKAVTAPPDLAKASDLERLLAPTLTELEAARTDIVHQINARLTTRVPLGVAAGVCLWILGQFGKEPATFFNLLEFMGVGGAAGWYWASRKLSEQYLRLYKDRVLPRLAAQFGSLSYRRAIEPDMNLLRAQHIFREFDRVVAEDEIYGTYRGMPLNIVELKLTYGSGKERRVEFDGLLTTVKLPRHLA